MNPIEDMTLRDYFAGQVIGPLMTSDGFEQRILLDKAFPISDLPKFAAEQAYAIADAMLRARSVPDPEKPREWWVKDGQTGIAGSALPYDPRVSNEAMFKAGWTLTREIT